MKPELLKSHDPRRNDAIGLVRREVRAGRLTKKLIAGWTKELGEELVSRIMEEEAVTVTDADDGEKKDSKKAETGTSK